MKTYSPLLFLLYGVFSNCLADAVYNEEQNQLEIPYLRFQDQFYQAEFSFFPPDKLELGLISSQREPESMTELVPVYDDLNFHLSEITVANKQYAADMNYLGNNIFQIHNLSESVLAYPSNTIFRSKHFSGSGICAKCHNNIKDKQGKDVSIISAWSTTMMANATRDPFGRQKSEVN